MPTFRYTNPIIRDPGLSLRDHCILKVDGRWWLTGTSAPVWEGPNPGVRLLVSDDLLDWRHHSWLVDATALPRDCFYRGRFWAPEIHRAHGRFWLTVNSGHRGPEHGERYMDGHNIVLFVADAVDGPYRLLTTEAPLGQGFKNDASLFTDDDGLSYLYCSGGGLWQAPIDLEAGRPTADLTRLRSPQDAGNPEWMIGGIEGPFVIKRDGAYFMLFSAWTRGYETGVLRAPTPLGPWQLLTPEPILAARKRRHREQVMREGGYDHLTFQDTPDPYAEVGHCAVFEGPDGSDWISCHYFLEGRQPKPDSLIHEYYDSWPQLGIEPLRYVDGRFRVDGPTWTEQAVSWAAPVG